VFVDDFFGNRKPSSHRMADHSRISSLRCKMLLDRDRCDPQSNSGNSRPHRSNAHFTNNS
jgi:hypothetical protein